MKNIFSSEKTRAEKTEFFLLSIRRLGVALLDALIINLAFILANLIEYYPDTIKYDVIQTLIGRSFYTTALFIIIYAFFGLYNSLWEYAGLHEMVRCACAGVLSTLVCLAADFICDSFDLFNVNTFSLNIYFTSMLVIIAASGCLRLTYRVIRRTRKARSAGSRRGAGKRVMIIGAGDMGQIILKELEANAFSIGKPVVFVDDNPLKFGKRVEGIPIKGGCEKIPELAKTYKVDEIIYAIPSAPAQRKSEILKFAIQTGCSLKTSPSLQEFIEKSVNEPTIRKVEITDLLARPEVLLNTDICSYLKDQTIMVTGGGGSIGSEICTQVARYKPAKVIIFDNYENNAFVLKNKLDRKYQGKVQFFIRIGSVQDPARLDEVLTEFKPSVMFHAAAHKHVPLMEDSPCEAVKNNIFGTYNTAKAAIEHNVSKFPPLV